MKEIIQSHSADLDWVDSTANQFGGKVDGNFILAPESINTGDRYFLKCEDGIVALYIDVTYTTDIQFIQKNNSSNSINFYYFISETDLKLSFEDISNRMGSNGYNLSVVDSALDFKYEVNSGTKSFIFCLFIKKEYIRTFAKRDLLSDKKIEKLFNLTEDTFISRDRMSNESYRLLTELRKQKVGGVLFDLNIMGTAQLLLSEYLLRVVNKKNDLQLVNDSDLLGIVSVQRYLMENLKNPFPGNKILAGKINMSESKFKSFFKKITGISPSVFFMENKLNAAKELLEELQLSIDEVSRYFNFVDSSYFSLRFKNKFGVSPKRFILEL